jgi:hypothetical protein
MFSLDTAIDIMFKIEIMIYAKDVVPEGHVASLFINQMMPIYALKDRLQKFINDSCTGIVQQYEKDGKKYIAEKLKKEFSTRPPLKFALQKEPGGSHVIVLNSPVEIRGSQNWLCVIFGLDCRNTPPFYAFKADTNYTSRNIHDMVYRSSGIAISWNTAMPTTTIIRICINKRSYFT